MRYQRKIDQMLLDQKKLVDDLDKYCHNKRLKKNIHKMDMNHNLYNGQKYTNDKNVFT